MSNEPTDFLADLMRSLNPNLDEQALRQFLATLPRGSSDAPDRVTDVDFQVWKKDITREIELVAPGPSMQEPPLRDRVVARLQQLSAGLRGGSQLAGATGFSGERSQQVLDAAGAVLCRGRTLDGTLTLTFESAATGRTAELWAVDRTGQRLQRVWSGGVGPGFTLELTSARFEGLRRRVRDWTLEIEIAG